MADAADSRSDAQGAPVESDDAASRRPAGEDASRQEPSEPDWWARWPVAAGAGVAVAALLALVPPVWPALAVAAGAAVVATLRLALARGRRRRYGAAGSVYAVALGAVVALGGPLPAADAGAAHLALLTLGGASALVVGAKHAVARGLSAAFRRLVRGGLRSKLVAVRTAAKALGSIRTAVALLGRFTRVAALALLAVALLALVGLATFALNALGVGRAVPWLGGEVDVVLLVFVGVTLLGFHALDAAESTWVATREGVGAGRDAAARLRRASQRPREERAESGPEE